MFKKIDLQHLNIRLLYKMILISAVLLLTSCTYFKAVRHSHALMKQCRISCLAPWNICTEKCQDNGQHCMQQCQVETVLSYRDYVREQTVQGVKIIRQLNSFRDPLKCSKVTCHCEADYQVCLKTCQGVRPVTQIKPAICC